MKKHIFTITVFLITGINLIAANYYWVGGSGNWNDFAAHWATTSGGSTFHTVAPASTDNVFFDANSFPATGAIVTINVDAVCADMTWTGVTNSPQLAGATTRKLSIYGSLTLVAGMNYNFLGDVYFESLSTGKTLTSAGQSFKRNVYFQGIGGYVLQDAFVQTGSFTVHFSKGTLDLNNQSFTANVFNTYYTDVRTLYLRSSIMTLASTSNSAFYFRGENFTLNAGSSLIKFTAASSGLSHGNAYGPGKTFYNILFEAATGSCTVTNYGGAFNNITFNSNGSITGGMTINTLVSTGTMTVSTSGNNVTTLQAGGNATLNHNSTYGNITLNGNGSITGSNTIGSFTLSAGKVYTFNSGTTQVVTGTISANGTCASFITLQSNNEGSQANISKASGSVGINYCLLKDMNATGGATFAAANSIDLGNNTGWLITPPTAKNLYWIGGTGNWNDPAHWSVTSGGTAGSCIPTAIDNVFFDGNSFATSGQTVTVVGDANTIAYCKNMTWTGVTNSPTFGGTSTQTLQVFGSLTLNTGMTYNFLGPIYFKSNSSGNTVFLAGKTLDKNHLYFDGAGGEWSLMDPMNLGVKSLYLMKGSLNTNNQSINAGQFYTYYTSARSFNMGSSEVVLTSGSNAFYFRGENFTFNAGTSLIRFTAASADLVHYTGSGPGIAFNNVTFEAETGSANASNNGGSFNNLTFNSDGTVTGGNTINNLTFTGTGTIGTNGNNYTTVVFGSTATINNNGTYGHVTMNGNGSITGNNTFGTLIFSAGYQYTLTNGKTQIITDELSAEGAETQLIVIKSSNVGSQTTFSKASGTVTVNYVSLQDNKATGGATFIANNSIDLGNNTGWTINATGAKNYYWVGGTGNYNDASKWSLTSGGSGGAGVPTAIDNVFFDANSFSSSGQIVTVIGDASNNARAYNMNWTGVTNNPTLAGASTQNLRIHGSLTLSPGMIFSFAGLVYFEATETGHTIFTGGILLDKNNTYFNGVGGEYTLQDALNLGSKTLYLVNGTLNTNNQTLRAGQLYSYYTSARTLSMGSSELIFSSGSNAVYYRGENFTVNPGTSLIRLTAVNADFVHYIGNGPGITFYDVIFEAATGTSYVNNYGGAFHNLTFNSAGDVTGGCTINTLTFTGNGTINSNGNNHTTVVFGATATINGNGTYGHVTITGNGSITGNNTFGTLVFSAGKQYTLTNGKTQVIQNDLIADGADTQLIVIKSSLNGSQSTFSKSSGTVTVNYVSLQDNNATGGAAFVANNSLDLGNNTGWTINGTGGKDYYWVGGTGNYNVASNWSLTSGGSGGAGVPTAIDNVYFDANSFTTPGQIVTIIGDASNNARVKNMNWTGVTNNPTLAGASAQNLRIYGSLTLNSAMTYTFAGLVYFESIETGQTIFTGGLPLDKNHIYFDGIGGEWTLQDGLNMGTKTFYLVNGTLNTNNYSVTAGQFYSYYTNARSFNLGSSEIILNSGSNAFYFRGENFTFTAGTSLIRFTSANAELVHYLGYGPGIAFNDVIFEAASGTASVYNYGGSLNNLTFNSSGEVIGGNTINSLLFTGNGTINTNGNNFNTVIFTGNATINGNGTYQNVTMNGNATINSNNTFGTLVFTAGNTYTITNNKTQIITTDLVADGTCTGQIIIQSNSTTTQTTITKSAGTVTVNQTSLQGLKATGGATFIANNSIDLGNNSGWTISPTGIQNLYWVGGTGNWNDVSHWAATSGGNGGYCLPSQLNNVVFDENSFTQTGQAVWVDIGNALCRDMDWSAALHEPTFTTLSNQYNLKIYGSLTLNPAMNFAFTGPIYFEGGVPGKSNYTITTAGNIINNNVFFNGPGGIWVLQDDFDVLSYDLYLNYGTLNSNGKTISCHQFNSSTNNTRSLIMGASLFILGNNLWDPWFVAGNNITLDAGTSEIRMTSSGAGFSSTGAGILVYNDVVFQNPGGTASLNSDDNFHSVTFMASGSISGTGNYTQVVFNGTGEIDGGNNFSDVSFMNNGTIAGTNIFNTLILSPGKTYLFASGQTQTIVDEMQFWGDELNPIYIKAVTSGSQATISKASGTVSGNYIHLQDMNATGGATFNVYRSTNLGNNTGWNFLEPPAPVCPANMNVCFNTEPFQLTGATPSGGTYSGTGVSGTIFSPAIAGVGTHTITYTYVDPSSGYTDECTFLITVKTIPDVSCPAYPNPVCLNASSFILTGGSPAGGSYSGPGVAGGIFIPSSAGAGTHTITYTVSDPETGCFNNCTFEITVNSIPVVSCPGNMSVLNTDPAFTLTATPEGGVYTGPGITGNTFSPSTAGPGVQTITYTYTSPETGCSASCSFTITVYLYQNISYVTGWNWISFNVLPSTATVNNVLAGFTAQNGDVLKNQTQTMLFNGTSWVPNLTIDPDKTYLLKTSKTAGTFTVRGFSYVDVQDPISINAAGWTWIGYKPRVQLSPAQAFVSLAGKFTNQDVLKNQTQTAIYNGTTGTWLPTTFKMNPGSGYKLKFQRTPGSTLIYPASDGSETSRQDDAQPGALAEGVPGWMASSGMETNMSIYIVDASINGLSLRNGRVAAFDAITHECRAVETFFDNQGKGQMILTVGFNSPEEGNGFYYKIWDSETGRIYQTALTGVYVNDDFQKIKLSVISTGGIENSVVTTITDSFEIPVSDQLQLFPGMDNGDQGIVNIPESNQTKIRIYPNPTNGFLNVEGLIGESQVMLLDSRGQLVYSGTLSNDFVLSLEQYPTGIYTLKIVNNQRIATRKIVVE